MSALTKIVAGGVLCGALIVSGPTSARAGDAAVVIFQSGQVLKLDDGFREISAAMQKLSGTDAEHQIVNLELNGGTLVIDVADVVLLCRDQCKSMLIQHQLDPQRASPAKSQALTGRSG